MFMNESLGIIIGLIFVGRVGYAFGKGSNVPATEMKEKNEKISELERALFSKEMDVHCLEIKLRQARAKLAKEKMKNNDGLVKELESGAIFKNSRGNYTRITNETLKKMTKLFMMKSHPDKNGTAEEFIKAKELYDEFKDR